MFKYKVSVIVPVYNCQEFLPISIDSLMAQTMPKEHFEVLLIDDGSADNSAKVCQEYAEKYSNIKFFSKPNGGVSSTRNFGIEHAQGKYLLYLDGDDTITHETLIEVSDFFDDHYDEVDMVTYRIVPVKNGKRQKVHYRFKVLKETGVYDLNEEKNCYITQTTMNICVKNMGEENILFDTALAFHEDQKYCFDVLSRKMKIGFVKGPEYHYLRHQNSATGSRSQGYYVFESATALWEELFNRYADDEVPRYLQALYVNDLNWKTKTDILLPYHYNKEQMAQAIERLDNLLKRVDDDVIMNHLSADLYYKLGFVHRKNPEDVLVAVDETIRVFSKDEEIYSSHDLGVVVTRFKVLGDKLKFDGFIKSPAFFFDDEKPTVMLCADGKRGQIEVTESAYCHYKSKMRTAQFWRISLMLDIEEIKKFHFEIEVNGHVFRPLFYFMPNTSIKNRRGLRSFISKGAKISYSRRKRQFTINKKANIFSKGRVILAQTLAYFNINRKIAAYRLWALKGEEGRIWLYQDRDGVFDNAYQQFIHDWDKNDGIKRYYILHDCDKAEIDGKFTPDMKKKIIIHGSKAHKKLYFCCEKILTSFSNVSNFCPFGVKKYRHYYDLTRYELVYLQHGVLHASLINMYAYEKCQVDRVVVSSQFEVDNFTNKYGYSPDMIIKSGMPRFDFIPTATEKKNRILLSPSWRSNLIGPLVNNQRMPAEELFVKSDFYKEVSEFINSPQLHELLEKQDLYLDFKNHPIFACYNHLFTTTSDRITVSSGNTQMGDYSLMITDYSSIVFDAVYMGCPILYFVPDYDLFIAGVSHNYRELDLPLEEGFGPFAKNAQELINLLTDYAQQDFVPHEPYASRMANFFLHKDENCRDRLYEELMSK